MFSKKKTECRVCGYRFTPERENIYTAEEPRSMADMLTKAPTRFSATDRRFIRLSGFPSLTKKAF